MEGGRAGSERETAIGGRERRGREERGGRESRRERREIERGERGGREAERQREVRTHTHRSKRGSLTD